jgi:hypothetical protein
MVVGTILAYNFISSICIIKGMPLIIIKGECEIISGRLESNSPWVRLELTLGSSRTHPGFESNPPWVRIEPTLGSIAT